MGNHCKITQVLLQNYRTVVYPSYQMLKNSKEMIHPDHLFLIVLLYSIMEDHKLLLNLLVESNRNIKYSAVCDMDGKILLSRHRPSEKNFLSLAETKKEL